MRRNMGTYNFSAEEMAEIIVEAVENVEGDIEFKELRSAFRIALKKIISNNIDIPITLTF
jgi:hypothetical protein